MSRKIYSPPFDIYKKASLFQNGKGLLFCASECLAKLAVDKTDPMHYNLKK